MLTLHCPFVIYDMFLQDRATTSLPCRCWVCGAFRFGNGIDFRGQWSTARASAYGLPSFRRENGKWRSTTRKCTRALPSPLSNMTARMRGPPHLHQTTVTVTSGSLCIPLFRCGSPMTSFRSCRGHSALESWSCVHEQSKVISSWNNTTLTTVRVFLPGIM